jgi:hypothetical protein
VLSHLPHQPCILVRLCVCSPLCPLDHVWLLFHLAVTELFVGFAKIFRMKYHHFRNMEGAYQEVGQSSRCRKPVTERRSRNQMYAHCIGHGRCVLWFQIALTFILNFFSLMFKYMCPRMYLGPKILWAPK